MGDREVNHLQAMEDLQVIGGEAALQEAAQVLRHAVVQEEVQVDGVKTLLHAAEALQMEDAKALVLLHEAREALANEPKEK